MARSCEQVAKILWRNHASPKAAHGGVRSTLSRISRKYIWTNMKADVVEYVSNLLLSLSFWGDKTFTVIFGL